MEIGTDDEAMLEALTHAGEEVIRAIADMQPIHDCLQAQTQHLNHEPPTAWNTLSNKELRCGDLLWHRERPCGVS